MITIIAIAIIFIIINNCLLTISSVQYHIITYATKDYFEAANRMLNSAQQIGGICKIDSNNINKIVVVIIYNYTLHF